MQQLSSRSELDSVLDSREAVVLKHGAHCSISANARKELTALAHRRPELTVATLEVTEHADLSEDLAERIGVPHQSPQVILFRDGAMAWHASHFDITASAVVDQLER